jgi:hypothetical protein
MMYRADALLQKQVLRLDSLGLTQVDNLEVFHLRELYLQVCNMLCFKHEDAETPLSVVVSPAHSLAFGLLSITCVGQPPGED